MDNADVAVIGGGPAGLQTARLLAEGGADVIVLEAKPAVGANVVCTGLIGRDVFSEFRLPGETIGPDFQEAEIVSFSGRSIRYRHPSPFASIVDRERFDGNLGGLAREAGAEIETGTMVRDVSVSGDGVTIEAERDGRPVRRRARLAVLATSRGPAPREAGLDAAGPPDSRRSSRDPGEGRAVPTIFVGPPTAPGGFAWSVPSGGDRFRIGLITDGNPRKVFDDFAARYYPRLDPAAPSGGSSSNRFARHGENRSPTGPWPWARPPARSRPRPAAEFITDCGEPGWPRKPSSKR